MMDAMLAKIAKGIRTSFGSQVDSDVFHGVGFCRIDLNDSAREPIADTIANILELDGEAREQFIRASQVRPDVPREDLDYGEMNHEVKAKWVAALRSGDYVQGRNRLRIPGGDNYPTKWCCLGVLCELHRLEFGDDEWENDGTEYKFAMTQPPRVVMDWVGIDYSITNELMSMNDGSYAYPVAKTFDEIADYIEATP